MHRHLLQYLSLLTLCLFTIGAQAQPGRTLVDSADGYIITLNSDTQNLRILLPESFHLAGDDRSFSKGVFTRDRTGNITMYVPSEIKGFGLRKRQIVVHYRSIQLKQKRPFYFFKAQILGGRLTLYYDNEVGAGISSKSSHSDVAPQRNIYSEVVVNFLLEDGPERLLKIGPATSYAIRKKLIRFFEDEPAMQQLVANLFEDFNTLPDTIKELNRQAPPRPATDPAH